MRALLTILVAIICVSCSKADVHRTSTDLKEAASEIKADPAVKRLGGDIKTAANEAGGQIKKGAAKAGASLKKAGADVKASADKAKDKADDKSSS